MQDRKKKIILFICNIILVVIMLAATLVYALHISRVQMESKESDFIRTIESMKSVSQNYIDEEKGYARDWASYISGNDMTLEEALDFLRTVNTNGERYAHIVDMDTYEAYSACYPKGEEKIDTYIKFREGEADGELPFGNIMEKMFENTDDEFRILGKYRLQETQAMAVGIGTRVSLQTEQGRKDYLLLRVIPVEILKKTGYFRQTIPRQK